MFHFVTKACPVKKGEYYYIHDYAIDEAKFPMPLPEGEFRLDLNVSRILGGVETPSGSSETYFRSVKE